MDQVLLDEFCAECGLTTGPFQVEISLKGETTAVHEFRQPFFVIGRRAGCDLLLDHWLVSRRHAYLQLIEGRFFCVDLGSRTGTHGGDSTERAGWINPARAIHVGPYQVRPQIPLPGDRDYPPLPLVNWTILKPGKPPTYWTMNRGLALVGRSPACKIRISTSDVSRFHCGLVLTTQGVWAIDLLSQRPIGVNGRVARFARVDPGDELQIGQHVLIPEYDLTAIERSGPKRESIPESSESSLIDPPPASTKLPDPTTDQLPALTPTVVLSQSRWNPVGSFSLIEAEPPKGVDPTVNHLVQQFGLMQQQMFDQFHQTMMMMFEGFAALHRETAGSIQQEVEEVRKLSEEIQALREETSRLAEATTIAMQGPAFLKADEQLGPVRNGHKVPPELPAAERFAKVVPPLPDPHVDIHAQLCQRLNTIEAERQTRWQKILAMMTTRS